MQIITTDLCDAHPDTVRVAAPVFRHFGQRSAFAGPAATLRVFEDNTLVRSTLETPGKNRVLVVDGGASMRCALMGDNLAQLMLDNDWAGAIIHGCIRDSAEIDAMDVGVRALATHPRKSRKRGEGEEGVTLEFAGVTVSPGDYVYADADGVIVSAEALDIG